MQNRPLGRDKSRLRQEQEHPGREENRVHVYSRRKRRGIEESFEVVGRCKPHKCDGGGSRSDRGKEPPTKSEERFWMARHHVVATSR